MPILFAAVLVIMGSFAMLLPAVMFVLANMGLSNSLSTPIIAVYSLAQFLAGPQWGRLSDKHGRKPVLCFALAGGGLSYGLMAYFSDQQLALFVCMAMAGFCAGSLAVVFAAVSDLTTAENRTKGMGIIGAGIGLSFVVGTAIGGSISGKTAATATMNGPASAASIACFLGVLLVIFFMRETRGVASSSNESMQAGRMAAFRKVAQHPSLLRLCLLIFAFTFCLALMEPIVPKYINIHFGWGPIEMRNVFIYIGIILVVVQGGLVGPIAKKLGELTVTRIGLAMMGGGLLLLAVWPQPIALGIALASTSIGTALFNASALSLASHEAHEDEKGAVLGVAQSMQALGRSIGPTITGLLFDLNTALPFSLGALIVLGMLIMLAARNRSHNFLEKT